jgi:glycosyltransferase involved in cell wall biosynthesis
MGHAAFQLGLERAFAEHAPDVEFRSVRLAEANRSDWLGRIAHRALTPRFPGSGETDRDWIRLRRELAGAWFLRRRLRGVLPRLRPDVLHLHTQSIGLLACDIMRQVPSVVSLDCTSAILARIHPSPAARTYRPIIKLETRCFQAAAHVVCWSEFARRSVIADYGVSPDRTSVIRPGVPRSVPVERAPRLDGKLRLLFVGNDFKRKGGEDLLAVFAERLHTSCELDIVSHGVDDLPCIEGLRLHKGLTAHSPALLRLYADADVFVMPTHEEAFGLVYLEAMAAGLPCIGTDVLAVPELVAHGTRGLIVRAGDRAGLGAAIERLREDAGLRTRLGAAGRAFAEEECDPATNCRRLAEIFESCQRQRRASSAVEPEGQAACSS